MDRESIWLWIFAIKAEEDPIAAHDDTYFGLVCSGPTWFWRLLYKPEYRGIPPYRFIQSPVEHNRRRIADQCCRIGTIFGRSSMRAHCQKNDYQQTKLFDPSFTG